MGHMSVLGRRGAPRDATVDAQWHRASAATPSKTLRCPTRRPRPLNSPLKKALLTGFHSTAKHNATKAVSPSSETMRTI